MARLVVSAVMGLTFATTTTASAQDLSVDVLEIIEVAEEAELDPVLLAGAVNSTGLKPRTYAVMVGHLKPPPPTIPAYTVWDWLSLCEAGGNWHNASNPRYKGGLQFDAPTWARHGGLAFASRADFATREQQIIVAQRTLAAQGWGAWPACSRRLGLR